MTSNYPERLDKALVRKVSHKKLVLVSLVLVS